jgi:hypothetical protein
VYFVNAHIETLVDKDDTMRMHSINEKVFSVIVVDFEDKR